MPRLIDKRSIRAIRTMRPYLRVYRRIKFFNERCSLTMLFFEIEGSSPTLLLGCYR